MRPEDPTAMRKVENPKKKRTKQEEASGKRGRREYYVSRALRCVNTEFLRPLVWGIKKRY